MMLYPYYFMLWGGLGGKAMKKSFEITYLLTPLIGSMYMMSRLVLVWLLSPSSILRCFTPLQDTRKFIVTHWNGY